MTEHSYGFQSHGSFFLSIEINRSNISTCPFGDDNLFHNPTDAGGAHLKAREVARRIGFVGEKCTCVDAEGREICTNMSNPLCSARRLWVEADQRRCIPGSTVQGFAVRDPRYAAYG